MLNESSEKKLALGDDIGKTLADTPLHTLIPAARTFSSVSSRSSNLRVLITRS